MIRQKNQTNHREPIHNHSIATDAAFLKSYKVNNGQYPLFQQVLIETRTDCNNHCPFCPHSYNDKPLGIMSWVTYVRIIEDLVNLGFAGRVALMVSNEPLLDNRIIKMIDFAKSKSTRLFLDITTNGRLLTLDFVDTLFEHGLDNLNINDYRGDRNEFPEKVSLNLIPIVNAYRHNPKLTLQKRSYDEQLPNYGGNTPLCNNAQNVLTFCNFPFRKLVLDYMGNVVVCCNDFLSTTNMGNIHDKTLYECWNAKEFNQYRDALVNGVRIGLCSKCNDSQDYNIFVQ